MALMLLRVLWVAVLVAADHDIPITWSSGARAVLPCQVALGERVQARRPPPPLEDARPRARPKLYFWTKDGQNVTSKRVSPTGALEVSRRRGGGVYQCLARHHGGLVMGYPTHLQFAAMEKHISLGEANTTTRGGQAVLFNCSISSSPPANVSWLKDDLPLVEDDRHYFLPHQLLITDVAETDQGLFRCVATNSYVNKTRTSQPGSLQVVTEEADEELAFLPVEVDRQILAPRGSRVVLPCPVKGWPRPKLIWQLQPPSGRRGELEVEDQVLVITSLQPDQEGNYTCAVDGRPDLNKTYSVTLTEPVTITIPPWSLTALGASTVRFNCTASGRPTPTVQWYKDGLPLQTSRRINLRKSADLQRTELVISGVTSDDAGVYQCFATNPVNTASFWALLNVTGADAEPPSNVRCWPVDERRVKITWRQPQGEVVAYTVHETPVEEKASNSVPGLPIANTKTEEIVEVASPLVPYRFQVRAYIRVNKSTASDLSEPAVCQGQGVPLRLIKLEGDAVLVSWKQFAESHPGVVQWVLQTTTDREEVEQNVTLDGSVYNYTLNAPTSSPLLVRVLGTRSLPWLPQDLTFVSWSNTAAATDDLDAGDEPATPTDIDLTRRDARSFTITWKCECVHCTYMVCVRSEMERCFESLEKSATLEELQPGSEYEVRVQARRQGQALGGAFSAPRLVTTSVESPQRFRDLQTHFVNSSTLKVSWNGEPARYKVHYSAQLRVPVEEWESVETMSNTVLIPGLNPGAKTYLMVTGFDPEEHSRVVTVPPYYKDLAADDVQYAYTSSGVKVWWSGTDGDPKTVSYSQNITKPVEHWAKVFVSDNWVELTVDPELPTYVMVSSSKQVITIAPRPRPQDYSALYLGIGVSVGIVSVCVLIGAVILIVWRRRKQGGAPRGRRGTESQGGPEEDTEMKVVSLPSGGLPNGGARGAGEPLLNGYVPVRITENPTSKTPHGKLKKGRRYEPAFDLARYEEPDTTLETVLDDSAPYSLLDTSRHPEYDPSRSSRELSANNSFAKLPDDNMNSEITKCIDNSKMQPTLQPNG